MTKKQFSQYTPREHGTRDIDEAIAEIQREMDVRKRLFDKWVSECRMSWVDANDRLCRHMSALKHLIAYAQILSEQEQRATPSTTTSNSLLSPVELDSAETEVPA